MTTTGIQLTLSALGYETSDVPVQVEIFDSGLNRIEITWLRARDTHTFLVGPGTYGIRASLASGIIFDQSIQVEPGEIEPCSIGIHEASPHESHEWAYLTQPIDEPGKRLMSQWRYEGVWMRMWHRNPDSTWDVVPIPVNDIGQATWNEDGVTYRFRTPGRGFYMLQVGGPRIPWKNIALPSSYEIMALIRPAAGPISSIHPLDVVVSSDDWRMESLLSLMQRGDISAAQSLADQSQLAEELLYGKVQNTNAAAVGGYFLLRMRDMERLHSWANNLANWFEWMADGAVIHAWQIITESKQETEKGPERLEQARERLLEAVSRGFPIYTEGLRLLRDGLLYFDRRARGADSEIADALVLIGTYAAAADWSTTTTTFTGESPDEPDAKSRKGTPRNKDSLIYVFDVPIAEIMRHAAVEPGEKFVADLPDGEFYSTLNEDGKLELEDGSSFKSLGALQKSVSGDTRGAWWTWRTSEEKQGLDDIVTSLRTLPKK